MHLLLSNNARIGSLAFVITAFTSILFFRKALAWGFIDLPDSRKVHTLPTPRTGGLAMVAGCLLTLSLGYLLGWTRFPALPWQTWLAGIGFVTIGGLDDRFSFHPRQKILFMLLLAALAAWPWTSSFTAHSGHLWRLGSLTHLVSFSLLTFWFMAVPNALNIEDAINGYMGGFTLLIVLFLSMRGEAVWIPLGALAAFLVFNWPKARHFMGDAGSFGCGFLLAEIILRGGATRSPLMALILTAPISLDVAFGLLRRHRRRMGFFVADRWTLPHHVLALTGNLDFAAAPMLWANAAGFIFLGGHPSFLVVQTLLFIAVLFYFNRGFLLAPDRTTHL